MLGSTLGNFWGDSWFCNQSGIDRGDGIMQLTIFDPGTSAVVLMPAQVFENLAVLVQYCIVFSEHGKLNY
jgi:hypothetical protein